MKRILMTVVAFFCLVAVMGQAKMELKNFTTVSSANDVSLTYNFLKDEWPDNANGADMPAALIRVNFEGLSLTEVQDIQFVTPAHLQTISGHFRADDAQKRYWVWVDAKVSNGYIEALIPGVGTSNRLQLPELDSKGIYEMTLVSEKTLTINVHTIPAGSAKIFIDGEYKEMSDKDIPGVRAGKHKLEVSYNGQARVTEEIEVSESNVSFGPYDLRPKKHVKFTSDPSNAALYINGIDYGRTPQMVELPYDSYEVEAKLGFGEEDKRSITINATSPVVIELEPVKKKTFSVYAEYDGDKVAAALDVDGRREGDGKLSYDLTKPIGKKVKVSMLYNGKTKDRTIKVKEKMKNSYRFKISGKTDVVWPWQREYTAAPVALTGAYVRKQLVTQGYGEKIKENGVWDDGKDEWLNGFQIGIQIQPALDWGLGLHTGLFYEYYYSSADEEPIGNYEKFEEHCLYLPVHGYFRLPLGEKSCIYLHGGMGFNYSLNGAYKTGTSSTEDFTDFYGDDAWPERFNMALEIGGGLRLGGFQINALWAKGINDHGSYHYLGDDYKTVQNKLTLGVAYVFSVGD